MVFLLGTLCLALHKYLNNQYWIVKRQILQQKKEVRLEIRAKTNAPMARIFTYVLVEEFAKVVDIVIIQVESLLRVQILDCRLLLIIDVHLMSLLAVGQSSCINHNFLVEAGAVGRVCGTWRAAPFLTWLLLG